MAKANNKTTANDGDVMTFLQAIENEQQRKDALKILKYMEQITGEESKMWGSSIIGFGQYHYRYDSGREGDFFKTGFSPRKQNISLYIMSGFERYETLLSNLGKYKTGKSCLYIKRLSDVDETVLKQLIEAAYKDMTKKYG